MDKRVIARPCLAVALVAAACQGSIDRAPNADGAGGRTPATGSANGGVTGGSGQVDSPEGLPAARIRRLSATEIVASAADAFLQGATLSGSFPYEQNLHHFDNYINGLSVSVEFADALSTYAQAVAAKAVASPATLLPCSPDKVGEATCLHEFLNGAVRRAYRRPLAADDEARLGEVFKVARAKFDFVASIGFVIEAMLQSPSFVFRNELGGDRRNGVARLDPYETASALSYFLWRTGPDDQLFEAARAGRLATREGLAAEARRLAADPRARSAMREFLTQWLETNTVTEQQRASTHEEFTPAVAESMQKEVAAIADDVLWRPGPLGALLQSTRTYVDPTMAKIYGVAAPADGKLGAVTLDPATRAGVLTMPAVIASHGRPSGFSPIFLGRFVRTRLLCQALPNPPNDVPPLPTQTPNMTTRERFSEHDKDPNCAACHKLMDPIGFGFERYDALGVYRDTEAGTKLSGAGELAGTDVDGKFAGPVELAQKLAGSAEVAGCFTAQLLEYAVGRDASLTPRSRPIDAAIAHASQGFDAAKGQLADLLAGLATTDAFVLRDATALP